MTVPGFDVRATAPYGLLLLRLALGIAFVIHGWGKLTGGVSNVGGFFGGIGIPAPGIVAWLVTIIELVGGLFLIVGFLTQISSVLIALVMLGAIVFAKMGQGAPFIDQGSITWEKELVFLAAALCLALAGPGALSVDDAVGGSRTAGARTRAA